MQHFEKEAINGLETRYKNNLINSVSGYKSANLIATKSRAGTTNLAVFNSIVHLGSNPALLELYFASHYCAATQLSKT